MSFSLPVTDNPLVSGQAMPIIGYKCSSLFNTYLKTFQNSKLRRNLERTAWRILFVLAQPSDTCQIQNTCPPCILGCSSIYLASFPCNFLGLTTCPNWFYHVCLWAFWLAPHLPKDFLLLLHHYTAFQPDHELYKLQYMPSCTLKLWKIHK